MKEFNFKYLNSEELSMLNRLLFVRMNYKTKLRQPADGAGRVSTSIIQIMKSLFVIRKDNKLLAL